MDVHHADPRGATGWMYAEAVDNHALGALTGAPTAPTTPCSLTWDLTG